MCEGIEKITPATLLQLANWNEENTFPKFSDILWNDMIIIWLPILVYATMLWKINEISISIIPLNK